MTTPRMSDASESERLGGASVVAGTAEAVRTRWAKLQRIRPWRTFSHFTNVGGNVLSAGMSYQAVFAVFAALWVGFGILGWWLRSRDELLRSLIEQINILVPGLVGDDGVVPLYTLLSQRSFDWSSLIAGGALIWVTLAWFTGTRRAIRIIFGLDVKQYRNALLLKLRDLVLAVLFLVALIVSAALTVFASTLTDWLLTWFGVSPENWLLGTFGLLARYAALYVFDVLVLLAIVRFLAEVRAPRWSILWGCALGGAVLFGLKLLGAWLLGGASSNPLLASFAVIIGLLIWFNLICRTLLLTAAWIATGEDRALGAPVPLDRANAPSSAA